MTSEERLFLERHQWETLEAAMARIIPTDDQPGAREAGTIRWLDRYLSGIGYIYAKPDGSGFISLSGKDAQAWTNRVASLRERYLAGIATLDKLSQSRFGADFQTLDDAQQDTMLELCERGEPEGVNGGNIAAGPGEPAPQQTLAEDDLGFFQLLVLHTRQAFYSDPVYGSNPDRVAWKLIGFDGPSSLAEVQQGRYSTATHFAELAAPPPTETSK